MGADAMDPLTTRKVPSEVVLQRGAEDAETDGEHEEGGDPEAVQPVFGLPDAAAPLADVHG